MRGKRWEKSSSFPLAIESNPSHLQEQINQARREKEKKLKAIYGNWKRLIKGLLVKERMKDKYGVYERIKEEQTDDRKKKKK